MHQCCHLARVEPSLRPAPPVAGAAAAAVDTRLGTQQLLCADADEPRRAPLVAASGLVVLPPWRAYTCPSQGKKGAHT